MKIRFTLKATEEVGTMDGLTDFKRLCVHTMTVKRWALAEAIEGFRAAGIPGITVWRQHLEPQGAKESGRMLRDSGIEVVSLCRGGFFPAQSAADRAKALDDNRRAIDEAAAIGAPLIVLVSGAVPGMPLAESRKQIADGIAAVVPYAEAAGVRLAIEPLHPMYAGDRCAVNTLRQANDLAEELDTPVVGVTVDVYHLWWDPDLESQIRRAGPRIFSFHVCDWRCPTRDLLNDRGVMGEGCIPIRKIRQWVDDTGYNGFIEVEIFSDEHWAEDPHVLLERIKTSYIEHV